METPLSLDESRPTRAEIRLGALRRNYRRAKELAGTGVKVMAVVKANAYGHGIARVAEELVNEGVDYLGVALLEEGMILRREGIMTPILVLGATAPERVPLLIVNGLDVAVPSIESARVVSAAAVAEGRRARIHLKVDTGMERIGEHWYSVRPFIDEALSLPALDIVGLFSHFATSDDDLDFAREQLGRFHEVLDYLDSLGARPPLVHMANSAALVNLPEARFDMVRPGIFLYGYEPTPLKRAGVEPVMRVVSRLVHVKETLAGAGVSYGLAWRASVDTRIATIPIGYGDGYSRALSNKGEAIIRGRRCPVVGRVCMDQIMVDLGPEGEASDGDEVLLLGTKGGNTVDGQALCDRIGTIPYEITCMVNSRVPRVYVED